MSILCLILVLNIQGRRSRNGRTGHGRWNFFLHTCNIIVRARKLWVWLIPPTVCASVYSCRQRWLAPRSRPAPTSCIALPLNPSWSEPTDIVFPIKTAFWKKTRAVFRSSSVGNGYTKPDASRDLAYCFTCIKALQSGKNINKLLQKCTKITRLAISAHSVAVSLIMTYTVLLHA